jgi:hypothetical protein
MFTGTFGGNNFYLKSNTAAYLSAGQPYGFNSNMTSKPYWTPENKSNLWPKADQLKGYDNYRGTMGYMKGDHIKLQQISLGYDFKKILPSLIKVQNARLYVQVKNAFYLYKACSEDINPEAYNFDFNIPRTYVVGLNINF